jgi:hypothetical protein
MGRRDLHDDITQRIAISPQSIANNTPLVSGIIDRQAFEGLEFIILTGSIASGTATFAVTVAHGEAANLSDAAAVDPTMLLGTLANASFTFANPNSAFRIGVISGKRYCQLTITPASNAAAALIGAVAVLFSPAKAPTPTP